MRALGIVGFVLALPLIAGAQDAEGAPPQVDSTPPAEAAPPPQAVELSPPPVPQPAPPPGYYPYQAPGYYGYPQQQAAPRQVVPAPPPGAYTPQPSPLVHPYYVPRYWPPPYVTPHAQQPYVTPHPQQPYVTPHAQQPYVTPHAQQPYVTPAPPPYYYPPQQYSLPPLPPGYAYTPQALPPLQPQAQALPSVQLPGDRNALHDKLYRIESRLDTLQRTRAGVGGPITAMVIGYATTVIAGAVSLGAAKNARDIREGRNENNGYYDRELDFNDDGDVDRGDRTNWVKTSRVGAGLSGAGLVIGLLGTAGLVKAVGERRSNNLERAKLRQQREDLRRQLDYGASMGPNQFGFSVRGQY